MLEPSALLRSVSSSSMYLAGASPWLVHLVWSIFPPLVFFFFFFVFSFCILLWLSPP